LFRAPSKRLSDAQKTFENIIKSIEETDLLNRQANTAKLVTDVEISLMGFDEFATKKPLTKSIIQEYYRLLFEELTQMKRIKQKEEKVCTSQMEEVTASLAELKLILNQHNKVMNDIKPLLKIMSKEENVRLQEYTRTYSRFSENCNELIRFLSVNEETAAQLKANEIFANICVLKQVVPRIYQELYSINETMPDPDGVKLVPQVVVVTPTFAAQRIVSRNVDKVAVHDTYAMNVWKRISQKLEGKDLPNQSQSMDIKTQVGYIINQAVDLNNLALLYEGWTPWV
jgi:PI-3-kinase-related kinase SMG-1